MRSKKTKIRQTQEDVLYKNTTVTKLINRVMKNGKKTVAEKNVYGALDLIKKQTNKNPLEVFEDALRNITPQMEVRSRRVGGAAYQVPMPVTPHRGRSLALRWLIQEANKRPNKEFHTFKEKLATEIISAYNNEGGSIQKRLSTQKMADANKAFAHFRW